ncbi:BatD family protein [Bermanella sp. WJH001]|uniref:BatD family protein n=1 Tax=Bermanella sp. WJH001 TaxID=3048005 RepID=UPI0024BD8D03|nr:BatD family protein [Bermanella sp. WJH001]MDJ1536669.1 BatD family protein [Bermanella sp. WJH001]
MVKHLFCLLILSFLTSHAFAVAFEASVDRSNIGEGESIMLTLRYNSNVYSGDPDLSPLEQQFTIINQQRKNSFQYINGQSDSWTVWTIAISPKRKGNLVVPSIEYKGERTKPIQIMVSKLDPSLQNQQKDVFFHTETDIKTSYVQGQIVYSEKLYFSVPLDNSQLNDVEVEDAVVQPLGETKQYRTQLNGRSFDVYERRYVIFAQTSGELIIPGPRYTGEISNGRWRPGRPISISHPPTRIQVLPQPANYPQNNTWLPAQDVSLAYKWLGNTKNLKQGEPITLSLSLKAKGLSAAQLPKLILNDVPQLKYYPEQPQTQDINDDNGITGVVSQNIAVVVTKNGEVRLPEIRIPWFNIKDGRIEYAVMPSQTLNVSAVASASSNTPQTNNTAIETSDIKTDSTENNALVESAAVASNHPPASNLWPILSLVFMLLWLITSYLLWRQYQIKPIDISQDDNQLLKPSAGLKKIKQACRNNDATAARQAIIEWAHAQGFTQMASLQQVASLGDIEEFKQALQELDYTLYSPTGNSAWQGEYLWQLIRNLKTNKGETSSPLQPLYPS